MSKQVKYGDFFLDPTKKRRIRKMRTELPLFEGDK